jgi:hypothetical protein
VPTVDEANVMHLSGRVVDARTGRPIAGVCIAIGVTSCLRAPTTDANGIFRVDLTLGQVLAWDLKFLRAGYFTAERMVPSRPGQVILSDTRMQPTK